MAARVAQGEPDRRTSGLRGSTHGARIDAVDRPIDAELQRSGRLPAVDRRVAGILRCKRLVQARLERRHFVGLARLRQSPFRLGDELIVRAAARRPGQIIGQGAERLQELPLVGRLPPGGDLVEIGDDDVKGRIAARVEIGGAPVECRGFLVVARRPHHVAPGDEAAGRRRLLGVGHFEFRDRLAQ